MEEKKWVSFSLCYKEARFFVLRGVWNGFLRERERETTMLLTDFGYKKSMTDSSLFVLDNSNDSVNMVGLLTDDLLLVMNEHHHRHHDADFVR